MNLVIFTAHYPYGKGEDFLQNEIIAAERYFDKITIVTLEKDSREITKYVPKCAEIIRLREKFSRFERLRFATLGIIRIKALKEIYFARKNTPYSLAQIIKGLLISEGTAGYLNKHKDKWIQESIDTIYYSYWLGERFYEFIDDDCLKISRAHGVDCFFDRGYHPYRRENLSKLDYVFPISIAGAKDIINHYRLNVSNLEGKVLPKHLGIELPRELNPGKSSQVYTIVTCSNIVEIKRLDLLINALEKIDDIDINWIHFGSGDLQMKIKTYAHDKLSKKHNIKYEFKGLVPNAEVFNYYSQNHVDLFINCSDGEGIPVAVMEAMSFGIPVLGRMVGGMDELIDETCGILLPEKISGDELKDAIKEILLKEEKTYLNLRKCARAKVEENYDAEQNYKDFFSFIINQIK